MSELPIPHNETDRIAAVRSYALLDTPADAEYDAITRLAAQICGTPVSLITLLDDKRQWFKSVQGTSIKETPREHAFCSYAIMEPGKPMMVPDLRRDERFSSNPLVTEDPRAVFYAGAPLVDDRGFPLGTLCVIDTEEKNLTEDQLEALQILARQVVTLLHLRRQTKTAQTLERLLEERNQELQTGIERLVTAAAAVSDVSQTIADLQQSPMAVDGTRVLLQQAADKLAVIKQAMDGAVKLA